MKEFLQSKEWKDFQSSTGKRAFFLEEAESQISIIEHSLPLVGTYFYVPRGTTLQSISNLLSKVKTLAISEKASWVRFDLDKPEMLESLKNKTNLKIIKAPHDMQPKEIFVIDIKKPENEILAQMKSKTRYNIRLAEKKGVTVKESRKYFEDFWRLTEIMARRQSIKSHPKEYYQKMLEVIPENILKLYVAEYEGKIIAADLVTFYDQTATYLHGSSDDKFRNVMAPHLLKWREIQEAQKKDCERFDFGGISTNYQSNTNIQIINKWKGITRFKLGFSKNTEPVRFLGSYDIIIDNWKYFLYRTIQKLKQFFKF